MSSAVFQKHIRVLALDAGGVRCLSSLRILQDIMQRIAPEGTALANLPKPCEHFDLICGSEYGAVLALMLGRLRMSIHECFHWFKKLELPEYSTVAQLFSDYLLNKTQTFAQTFKELLDNRGLSESELLFESTEPDTSASACKTFALVIDLENVVSPVRLRSYVSKSDGQAMASSCTILQAAMAAIMIPLKHKSIRIDSMYCISASRAGFSNPSREGYDEGTRIWSSEAINTVVSLGTGRQLPSSLSSSVSDKFYNVFGAIDLLKYVAANSERASEELYRDARINGFNCSRFTLYPNLVPNSCTDWSQMTYETIKLSTEAYIGIEVVKSSLKGCARSLLPRSEVQNLERQQDPMDPHPMPEQVPLELLSTVNNHPSISNIPSEAVFRLFDGRSSTSDVERDKASDTWINEFCQNRNQTFEGRKPEKSEKVKIAIIDTGLDGEHPSVVERWLNPHFHHKYKSFLSEDSTETYPKDTCGHGTYVAGIFLQLSPDAELYVARVFSSGSAREFQDPSAKDRVLKAIDHAREEWNVDIISISFGFDGQVPKIREAITHAYNSGIVIVAAASNDGNRMLRHIAYPASQLGQVICMNSADSYGARSKSNPPPAENRDNFSILGENVKSIWPAKLQDDDTFKLAGGTWRRMSGTSVATPIAAALAALVIQYKRMSTQKIEMCERLESFDGIKRMFANMSLGRKFEGFDNILPAALFGPGSRNFMPSIISQEMMKI